MMFGYTCRWETRGPIAERLSFSSFSQDPQDYWSSKIVRPYAIAILPGYTVPDELDRESKDSMWYEGKVTKPMLIWDGYCPKILFEVIREALDPAGTSEFIKVYQKETKQFVEDDRDPEILALRPVRPHGLTPAQYCNHLVEVYFWMTLFGKSEQRFCQDFSSVLRMPERAALRDDYHREQLAIRTINDAGKRSELKSRSEVTVLMEITGAKPKIPLRVQRGPLPKMSPEEMVSDSLENPMNRVGFGTPVNQTKLELSDLGDQPYQHGDYYRIALEKGLRMGNKFAERPSSVATEPSKPTTSKSRWKFPKIWNP